LKIFSLWINIFKIFNYTLWFFWSLLNFFSLCKLLRWRNLCLLRELFYRLMFTLTIFRKFDNLNLFWLNWKFFNRISHWAFILDLFLSFIRLSELLWWLNKCLLTKLFYCLIFSLAKFWILYYYLFLFWKNLNFLNYFSKYTFF
jgi:hypothetical protein